jgi:hypothetical protein
LPTRLLVAAAAALGMAACSDQSPTAVRTPQSIRKVTLGGTETLSSGLNLSVGSYGSWNVSMPTGASIITLSFDGKVYYSSTIGNSTILEITVNGYTVTGGLQKGSTYSYPNRGGTEYYYDNRGSYWGQSTNLWGLFWSPNWSDNNTSSNYYYVSGGNAYNYVFDVTGLVSQGQVNTIQIKNQGGWVYTATGLSPQVNLQNVAVSAN